MTNTFLLTPECLQWCKEQHYLHDFEFMYAFLAAEIALWYYLMIIEYGSNNKRNKKLLKYLPWFMQAMMLTAFMIWWWTNR